MIFRTSKEERLAQRSKVIWMTGMSGAGKTTIATLLEFELFRLGYFCQVLDGDQIRGGINKRLGFSVKDREENIRRVAEVAKLFLNSGVITITCTISPTNEIRQLAQEIIGEKDFLLTYINTPFEVCKERDVKGMYRKALMGRIKNFTGIDSPYVQPKNHALEIETVGFSPMESVQKILLHIQPMIKL